MTSPEKVVIHATTDSEMRSSTTYFPLRKILHTGAQQPIVDVEQFKLQLWMMSLMNDKFFPLTRTS